MECPSPNLPPTDVHITDEQVEIFQQAVDFWRVQSEQRGVAFEWFAPRLWKPSEVIIGNGLDTGFGIRPAPGGYELVMTREREGEDSPTFYSRYDDAVKDVARVLGRTFRMDAYEKTWLTWRHRVADGVSRDEVRDGWARYILESNPSVYCVIGSYDGNEFNPALTMGIEEFNQAILNDPGELPPGRR